MNEAKPLKPVTLPESIRRKNDNVIEFDPEKWLEERKGKMAPAQDFIDKRMKQCASCDVAHPACLVDQANQTAGLRIEILGQGHEIRNCEKWTTYRKALASALPQMFIGATFDSYRPADGEEFTQRAALSAARRFVGLSTQPPPLPGLLLSGNPGSGKTHLACAVLNWENEHGGRGYFANVPRLLSDLRRTFGRGKEGSSEFDRIMERLETAPLLILDDFGRHNPTNFGSDQLYLIVDDRWTKKRRTVVTSNFGPEELLKKFKDDDDGEAIVSRLLGLCEFVPVVGPDGRSA
ncbi:MAG: ATP-binding protein [Bdellovibrionota bacterium]